LDNEEVLIMGHSPNSYSFTPPQQTLTPEEQLEERIKTAQRSLLITHASDFEIDSTQKEAIRHREGSPLLLQLRGNDKTSVEPAIKAMQEAIDKQIAL